MSARSVGEANLKITGNAQQLVQEVNRADASVRGAVTRMDRELGKLQNSLSKKFSASDIGKGLVQGLGIGSGIAAAQTASELISGYWRVTAEEAQAVADASAEQLASVRAIIAARQTDDQQRETAWKIERDAMHDYFAEVKKEQQNFANTGLTIEARAGGWLLDRLLGNPTDADVAKKNAEWQKAFQAFDSIARKVEERNKSIAVNSALDAFFAPLDAKSEANFKAFDQQQKNTEALAKRIADANEWRTKTQLDYNAALEREAEALMRTLATPQEEHAARLKRIETLYRSGKLTVEQYTRAMTESFKTLDAEEMKNVEESLHDFFDTLDEKSTTTVNGVGKKMSEFDREMGMMWNNVSDRAGQAFADMVLTGEASFGQLADIVARSMLEIVARMAIINPLLNMVFGGMGGWTSLPTFFGGGKAGGGDVSAGMFYKVNERGTEMLSVGGSDYLMMGANSGRVTPASSGSRATGNTYIFNLPGGVSESVFSQFASAVQAALGPGQIERRALAAVSDRSMRTAY